MCDPLVKGLVLETQLLTYRLFCNSYLGRHVNFSLHNADEQRIDQQKQKMIGLYHVCSKDATNG